MKEINEADLVPGEAYYPTQSTHLSPMTFIRQDEEALYFEPNGSPWWTVTNGCIEFELTGLPWYQKDF